MGGKLTIRCLLKMQDATVHGPTHLVHRLRRRLHRNLFPPRGDVRGPDNRLCGGRAHRFGRTTVAFILREGAHQMGRQFKIIERLDWVESGPRFIPISPRPSASALPTR